ncbi:MAG: hypothetical protein ACRDWD_02820 [Acidimicrobiia bacterium]
MGGTNRTSLLRVCAGAALAALVAVAAGCGDDGPSASDVSDNLVQACADALGLDPEDFAQFSDVDSYDELTDVVSDNTDEFGDFTDEFTDTFTEEFSDFQDSFEEQFTDEFTDLNEATDEAEQESILEGITESEEFEDLFGPFEGCADVVRTLVAGGIAGQLNTDFSDDFTDFTDFTGSGDFTDDSGTDFTDDSGSGNP